MIYDTPAEKAFRESPPYLEATSFLYERLNYEKNNDQPYNQQNYRLNRMRELLEFLGSPHLDSPVVHVAGTKGKGSVTWLLAETLRLAGFKTGLYTSPHLLYLEERFMVDGIRCSPMELVRYVEQLRPAVDHLAQTHLGAPTFFELTTAMAWLHFRAHQAEIIVLETGLGGRLDSTNVCSPCLTIITSISLDHQAQLGNTLGRIAGEKAGIIKTSVPVISGATASEARAVIDHVALQNNSKLYELDRDFTCEFYIDDSASNLRSSPGFRFQWKHSKFKSDEVRDYPLRMLGAHQARNSALVCAAVDVLRDQGKEISDEALKGSLATTQVPARMESLRSQPDVVLDTAHNPASIEALIESLRMHFHPYRRILVFAASRDKDYEAMLQLLTNFFDIILLTQFHNNPRAIPIDHLSEVSHRLLSQSDSPRPSLLTFEHPSQALAHATKIANPDDLVCITGSFFLASEILLELDSFNNQP